MTPTVSVIIPAYNVGPEILSVLKRIGSAVTIPCEIVVVVDSPEDSTIPYVHQVAVDDVRIMVTINTYGRGPANAIRFGIDQSTSPVVVVTMADGCDDPHQIDVLARLVERGVVVAAASRYTRGGQQVGGPLLKGAISKMAGLTLYHFARVGTRDATNSFKAYSKSFIQKVGIESDQGFEIGIELVSKARRCRLPVAEIPTIWLDLASGVSNFKLVKWLPRYIHWYFYAFGLKKKLEN